MPNSKNLRKKLYKPNLRRVVSPFFRLKALSNTNLIKMKMMTKKNKSNKKSNIIKKRILALLTLKTRQFQVQKKTQLPVRTSQINLIRMKMKIIKMMISNQRKKSKKH